MVNTTRKKHAYIPEVVLDKVLPDPACVCSKRAWESKMQKARTRLRIICEACVVEANL